MEDCKIQLTHVSLNDQVIDCVAVVLTWPMSSLVMPWGWYLSSVNMVCSKLVNTGLFFHKMNQTGQIIYSPPPNPRSMWYCPIIKVFILCSQYEMMRYHNVVGSVASKLSEKAEWKVHAKHKQTVIYPWYYSQWRDEVIILMIRYGLIFQCTHPKIRIHSVGVQ